MAIRHTDTSARTEVQDFLRTGAERHPYYRHCIVLERSFVDGKDGLNYIMIETPWHQVLVFIVRNVEVLSVIPLGDIKDILRAFQKREQMCVTFEKIHLVVQGDRLIRKADKAFGADIPTLSMSDLHKMLEGYFRRDQPKPPKENT